MAGSTTSPAPGYSVEFRGDLAILWMNNGENRFNLDTIAEIQKALDVVERSSTTRALITTGVGKFYSNGFDLEALSSGGAEKGEEFIARVYELWVRLMTFPIPTVAAINGHCYAGGGLFALSHDYRVMRTRRGWWCFPEIQLQLPFRPEMLNFLHNKLPSPSVVRDMLLFGKRYLAEDLVKLGVIDGICEQSGLMEMATNVARNSLGKDGFDRNMLKTMKEDINKDSIHQFVTSPYYKAIKSKL
ncbi:uncharacterized protein LOC144438302 [Glandiceps talaboti]